MTSLRLAESKALEKTSPFTVLISPVPLVAESFRGVAGVGSGRARGDSNDTGAPGGETTRKLPRGEPRCLGGELTTAGNVFGGKDGGASMGNRPHLEHVGVLTVIGEFSWMQLYGIFCTMI